MNGSFCDLYALAVGLCFTLRYFRYAVLTKPNQNETAVHCCDPTSSVLVMLVSRNVFHVASALQSIWLIRSLVDPTLAAFILFGPLQFVYPVLARIMLQTSCFRGIVH